TNEISSAAEQLMKNANTFLFMLCMTVSLSCSLLKNKTATATPSGTTSNEALRESEDQIVLKEIAAAELDCRQARAAIDHLVALEQKRRSANLPSTPDVDAKLAKLKKIAEECGVGPGLGNSHYRVAGVSNNVSFTGEICSLDKPFDLDATFPGGTAKTTFAPGGTTRVSGGGGGCTHTGEGNYNIATKADGSATLTWTTTDKLACPGFGNSRTVTFKLPLQPAPEISCP
ncbi:MAG: hypothetical protein ABI857_11190, partial [Acidobacteriota bacterium]